MTRRANKVLPINMSTTIQDRMMPQQNITPVVQAVEEEEEEEEEEEKTIDEIKETFRHMEGTGLGTEASDRSYKRIRYDTDKGESSDLCFERCHEDERCSGFQKLKQLTNTGSCWLKDFGGDEPSTLKNWMTESMYDSYVKK